MIVWLRGNSLPPACRSGWLTCFAAVARKTVIGVGGIFAFFLSSTRRYDRSRFSIGGVARERRKVRLESDRAVGGGQGAGPTDRAGGPMPRLPESARSSPS